MQVYKVAVEIEPDECGYHAALIDVSDDSVLYVGDSHNTPEQAEWEARRWIETNA